MHDGLFICEMHSIHHRVSWTAKKSRKLVTDDDISRCVRGELEKMGQKFKLALRIIKDDRFERLNCMHKGTYADGEFAVSSVFLKFKNFSLQIAS